MSDINIQKLIAQSQKDGPRTSSDIQVPRANSTSLDVDTNRYHTFGLQSSNQYVTEYVTGIKQTIKNNFD